VPKIDTEWFPSLAAQYKVRSIPDFAVFSQGQLQFEQETLLDTGNIEMLVHTRSIPQGCYSVCPRPSSEAAIG
jgi:hypothetical protein